MPMVLAFQSQPRYGDFDASGYRRAAHVECFFFVFCDLVVRPCFACDL